MKIAVTCLQMIRDLDQLGDHFRSADLLPVPANVSGQFLEGKALIAALTDCTGVIAGDDQFSREVLEACSSLKVISKWGIGVDGIDHASAARLGIRVRNTPGMFGDEVGDVTMAYLTDLARELTRTHQAVQCGEWYKPTGTSLAGSTLGIIGLGTNGLAVARRAAASGMRIIGTDPSKEAVSRARLLGISVLTINEVFEVSDFITVHTPLTTQTRHLLDAESFRKMRNGVRIVNTSRGSVIDTDALIDALQSGKVAGAALDVMEEEPLPYEHPLRTIDSVIFGSHNASNTVQACARVHRQAITNLIEELG